MGSREGNETEDLPGATARQDPALDLDDAMFGTPSCPSCLHGMTPASTTTGGVYWSCLHCGQSLLA